MTRDRLSEGSQITIDELRQAVLFLADAVLELTREIDTPVAMEVHARLRAAVELLVKHR